MNDFYKNFPSLNINSKENRKHQQINREFNEYLRSNKTNRESSKPTKATKHERIETSGGIFIDVEAKNQKENERRLESKRDYQKCLQDQINESRQRKELQKLQEEQEKFLAER